jgi:hypothetical protein
VFAAFLTVLAILVGLGGLVGWIMVWLALDDVGGAGILGVLIFQLLFVVVIYMAVHAIAIRATEARGLNEPDHPLAYLAAIGLRLTGELVAIWIGGLSIAGGVAALVAGSQLGTYGSPFGYGSPFSSLMAGGGLVGIVAGLVLPFIILVVFYWLAEKVTTGAMIARNTRLTWEALGRPGTTVPAE